MAGKPVAFHPEALAEAQAAIAWYRERSVLAANAFITELGKAVDAVYDAPQRWPLYLGETRRFPLRRFPFWVIYREKPQAIEVLAVAHARRRPGYWRARNK
jgi:plasmid stabilization system protein ParE